MKTKIKRNKYNSDTEKSKAEKFFFQYPSYTSAYNPYSFLRGYVQEFSPARLLLLLD